MLPLRNEKFLCARLRTSPSKCTRKPRIVSLRSFGTPAHRGLRPSTMSLHSSRASRSDTLAGSRYDSISRIADRTEDGRADGIRRTSLDLMSPIEGPPRTRIISLEDPPSSETGRAKHALSKALQIALPPDPPDITTTWGGDSE